jgi:hypothetical protein
MKAFLGGGLMARSAQPRKTASLPASVQQQLNKYALAAGARADSLPGLAVFS